MSVQWSKSHIDGLAPGTQFRIEATMPGKGFFQVVLENARGNEVFHYSVNIDPPNVEYTGNPGIRNWSHCWHLGRKREWDWFGDTIGTTDNDVPFQLGKKFTLVLQALNDGIEIMVDGKHVYTANGWSEGEMRDISQLKIKGTITVHRVDEQEFSGQKTVENPSIPAKLEFARFGFGRGLGVGTRIRIVGTPVAPRRFQFDLVESANGNGGGEQNIHFHFNPRFSEKQVVRNNLIKGMGWQTEERDGGFPFVFGRQFTVDIVGVLGNRVQVLIDEKPFCEYSPRGGDLSAVDRLEIQGDVTVKSVTMFGTSAGDVFGGQFGADIGQMMMGMGQSGIGMMQYMSG